MRRLTQGSRVLYMERHRGESVLSFAAALLALAIAGAVLEKGAAEAVAVLTALSLGFALLAATRLLKSRCVVIDVDQDLLSERTRSAFGRKEERMASLRGLSLLLEGRLAVIRGSSRSGGERRILHQDLWIAHRSGERWLFDRDLPAPAGTQLAERLAQDLGCGIVRQERQVW